MDDLLSKLQDIEGLDTIGWWPPAPGWIALAVLMAVIVGVLSVRLFLYRRTRQKTSLSVQLRTRLEEVRAQGKFKDRAAALSEWMRQAAILRYGRPECAGLEGQAWLVWLQDHDPKGFDWTVHGRLLIEAPYAPPATSRDNDDMEPLLKAAEKWVP